jgi:hypothetical protein
MLLLILELLVSATEVKKRESQGDFTTSLLPVCPRDQSSVVFISAIVPFSLMVGHFQADSRGRVLSSGLVIYQISPVSFLQARSSFAGSGLSNLVIILGTPLLAPPSQGAQTSQVEESVAALSAVKIGTTYLRRMFSVLSCSESRTVPYHQSQASCACCSHQTLKTQFHAKRL